MTRASLAADASLSSRALRVAIACPGVGVVQRGFERLFADLFHLLGADFELTLFKGGGEVGEHEKVLPFIQRGGRLAQVLPVHKLFGRTPHHTECLTFGMALLPYLRGGRFDLVHIINPPLARLLNRARDTLRLDFQLLFTEGCAMSPGDYPPADFIHQVSPVSFDAAVAHGFSPDEMALIPVGFHSDRFQTGLDRVALRARHGIGRDTFVILSVAAINRDHKRTDYLIDEVAGLEGDILLWMDGSLENGDPDLIGYAKRKLGSRCRFTHVASDKVGELYGLADVMAHAATFEAFGLAMVEAAACGVPMLIHNAPHFQWLIPNAQCWVDMNRTGALRSALAELVREPSRLNGLRCAQATRQRFGWPGLRAEYADLYRRVAALPRRARGAELRRAELAQ